MKNRYLLAALILTVFALSPLWSDDAQAEPKSKGLPILLNILPGFGVGSYVQGDKVGGTIQLVADIVGYGIFLVGDVMYSKASVDYDNAYYLSDENAALSDMETGLGVEVCGDIVIIGATVYGIFRPISFANSYNKEHGLVSLDVRPTISLSSYEGRESPAPGFAVRLLF